MDAACRFPRCRRGGPFRPARGVAAYRTAERYGLIWVALDEPRAPIPSFPEHDDPSYERYFAGAYCGRRARRG